MDKKAAIGPSNDAKFDCEGEPSSILSNRIARGPNLGLDWLPANLRLLVADYFSDNKRDPIKFALLGKQTITLCLSQHAKLTLGSCWYFGCLSSEDEWEPAMQPNVDMQCNIKDYQSCLDFLCPKNSPYSPIAIDVLVIQMDVSSDAFLRTLADLRNTLTKLQNHLSGVQHVVFPITESAFCCFSFKDISINEMGQRQRVDPSHALMQILDDLRTCWEFNRGLSPMLLLDYYFLDDDDKPKSDMYLSKFVISISHRRNRDLFAAVDPTLNSGKLSWIYYLETADDLNHIDRTIACRCHAIFLDASKEDEEETHLDNLHHAYDFQDNPFVERIVLRIDWFGCPIELARPSPLLTDTIPLSALVELTLEGQPNALPLTQLNNGFFKNLTHLSVIDGHVTGYLDSCSVPRLKKLILELGDPDSRSHTLVDSLVRKLTQSLIHTHRPWQVVASQKPGGWSLASYDEPTTNPQEDLKNDTPSSPLLLTAISELILVGRYQENFDEWQSPLSGNPSMKEATKDHGHSVLIWVLECVKKITAFCTSQEKVQFEFNETIPDLTPTLTFLECYNVETVVDGGSLPSLQSLEVNFANVELLGNFPQLKMLTLANTDFRSSWEVSAPLLKSLSCLNVRRGDRLSLRPPCLPLLSYLRIKPWAEDSTCSPTILVDNNNMGLSHVKHVVYEKGMGWSSVFDECQMNRVSHLELTVNVLQLPPCWSKTVWQCETLTLNVYALNHNQFSVPRLAVLKKLPELPFVKRLTVTEENCCLVLNTGMPNLLDCIVPSPKSFGDNFKCPALRCICFTGKLSASDIEKCMERATYEAIGAKPIWVYFAESGEVHRMSWDVAPRATGESSLEGPFEKVD